MEPRLMASINRRLKKGMNAHCSVPGLVEKKGGDADERAPRCSERERGRESADRRVLLRSERGKGEARGLSVRGGPRLWLRARRVRGWGARPTTAQGQG